MTTGSSCQLVALKDNTSAFCTRQMNELHARWCKLNVEVYPAGQQAVCSFSLFNAAMCNVVTVMLSEHHQCLNLEHNQFLQMVWILAQNKEFSTDFKAKKN